MKTGKLIYCRPDHEGNEMRIFRWKGLLKVYLFLPRVSDHPRKLGEIDPVLRTLTVYRNRETHLHFKKWAYGFNHFLIKEATKFDEIIIREKFGKEKYVYRFPRSLVLEEGEVDRYVKTNFETQIFLSFETIKKYSVEHLQMTS